MTHPLNDNNNIAYKYNICSIIYTSTISKGNIKTVTAVEI